MCLHNVEETLQYKEATSQEWLCSASNGHSSISTGISSANFNYLERLCFSAHALSCTLKRFFRILWLQAGSVAAYRNEYTSDLVIQYICRPRESAASCSNRPLLKHGVQMDHLSLQEAPLMFCCAMLSGAI